jgi:hypothetical protein
VDSENHTRVFSVFRSFRQYDRSIDCCSHENGLITILFGVVTLVSASFVVLLVWFDFTIEWVYVCSGMLSYGLLSYCYFHFVNLGETARRIRLLREIASSKQGLTIEQILVRYNSKEMYQKRLARLTKSGQLKLNDQKAFLAGKQLLFSKKLLTMVKRALYGKSLCEVD